MKIADLTFSYSASACWQCTWRTAFVFGASVLLCRRRFRSSRHALHRQSSDSLRKQKIIIKCFAKFTQFQESNKSRFLNFYHFCLFIWNMFGDKGGKRKRLKKYEVFGNFWQNSLNMFSQFECLTNFYMFFFP